MLLALSGFNAIYQVLSGLGTAMSPPDIDFGILEQRAEMLDELINGFGKYGETLLELKPQIEEYDKNLMLNLGNLGAATFLFGGIQAIGVYMMYQLNRIGFSLYMLAQIGFAASPAIFGGFNEFGKISFFVFLIWNFIWVGMYATQLKHLRS